jgi:hypothetical protein
MERGDKTVSAPRMLWREVFERLEHAGERQYGRPDASFGPIEKDTTVFGHENIGAVEVQMTEYIREPRGIDGVKGEFEFLCESQQLSPREWFGFGRWLSRH